MDTLDIVFMPKQIASQLVIALALETSMVCEESQLRLRGYRSGTSHSLCAIRRSADVVTFFLILLDVSVFWDVSRSYLFRSLSTNYGKYSDT